ncbi:MAG: hypothetical protein ACYSSP_12350 [Planctomycetota bacterium]|jgi:uncharacterized protein YecA (UPF0149 family)
MKTVKVFTLILVLLLSLIFLVYGCKKKSQPAETPEETTTTQESIEAVVTEKTEEIKEVVETLKANVTTSISEIKAEVEKLNVDQLKATALQYQQLIQAKSAEIEKLTAVMSELSIDQVLGEEGKAIKADVEELNKSITALKERFQIYYNKLKEKGGDLTGLAI